MTIRNVDDIYPLTPMQQLMLTHALAAPDSPVLSNQFCYRISGIIDVEALQRSWEDVVRRHPALRTAFIWEGLERPLQAVRSNVTLPFELHDLRTSGARWRDEVARLRQDDQARRYTLTRAPLTRVTLIRIADEQHLLVWNVHHLVADRWSLGPLLEDLRQFYGHRIEGGTWNPPQAPGFRAYVAWTLERPSPAAEAYWRSALHGFQHPTLLGSGGPVAAGVARASIMHRLAPGVLAGLRARAASWSVAVGSPILAAIATALAQECRQRDVVFALTVSGRPSDLPEAERTVGSFINNLPVRVNLTESDQTLHELTRRLQAAQAQRQPFEHVSAADLRAWCEVRPSAPLFDLLAVINLEVAPNPTWPGLELRAEIGQLDGAYPFVLGVGIDEGELVLSMTSADQARATRFLAQLSRALESMASSHASTVGDLVPVASLRESPPTDTVSRDVPARPPALTTAESVLEIWRELLGGAVDLSFDDDLLARGATSLQIVHAFALMEHRLGRTAPLATIFTARSVRGLAAALGEPVERVGSLVPIRASGRRPPLFAVPGIGGNVVSLTALARVMTADQPFYGLQSKGLDGLEPPRADIRTIAREFVSEIEGEIRVPYALLGICWGAAVAFEMARILTTAGRPPALLALLDPADIRGGTGLETPGQHRRVEFVRERLRSFRREIQGASVGASAGRVLAKIRRAGTLLTDPAAAAATRSDFHRFSVERANLRAVLAYRPTASYAGDGVLFLTRDRDPHCAEARLDWLQLIEPSPSVRYVSGSTVGDVLAPQNAPELAAGLREEIDRAVQRLSSPLPDAATP